MKSKDYKNDQAYPKRLTSDFTGAPITEPTLGLISLTEDLAYFILPKGAVSSGDTESCRIII